MTPTNSNADIQEVNDDVAQEYVNLRQKGEDHKKQEDTALLQDTIKLIYGAGGIFGAYLFYGSLQEDVFNHIGSNTGTKFVSVWFLQVFEAYTNVVVGCVGWFITSKSLKLPQKQFMITGMSQVSSKAFTALSLANGVSYPVAILAKSAKMAPVMTGSMILGGAVYSLRDYIQIGMILIGTAIVSMGKGKGGKSYSTPMGLLFIILSLVMDGITGGVQKRILQENNATRNKPKPYDFMLFTNFYMMLIAFLMSILTHDIISGMTYCTSNPEIIPMIAKFSVCSAIGQSFIFYIVAHFDPLVCSTVTTTRKIFSVLLSICLKGHHLTNLSWIGVVMAVSGIVCEVEGKIRKSFRRKEVGI